MLALLVRVYSTITIQFAQLGNICLLNNESLLFVRFVPNLESIVRMVGIIILE